ncbi:hypothetical protein JOB18_038401 [Solea senegalensis]|uniref:Uncharacterized protein n=1 Tax=Solea senegalensis TaxID=28829 RepID=A0AAV6STT1_SOLSE|nr:hypothetical protein JOB18_038401 [Solea senegalensis]
MFGLHRVISDWTSYRRMRLVANLNNSKSRQDHLDIKLQQQTQGHCGIRASCFKPCTCKKTWSILQSLCVQQAKSACLFRIMSYFFTELGFIHKPGCGSD